jgi:hypothetical protein
MVKTSLIYYPLTLGDSGGRIVISVRDCATFSGLTAKEICLGASPCAKHRVLQSGYLLSLWRGPKTVRKLIVADVRRWTELGAPDRAADAFLVLRQFLSDFPEARIDAASTTDNALRARSHEMRHHRSQKHSRRRAFKVVTPEPSCPEPGGGTTQAGEVHPENPEIVTRKPNSGRQS